MPNFSKNRRYVNGISRNDLTYKTILRIAEMRIIDKKKPAEICRELKVPYNSIIKVISAQKQNKLWVSAIADLANRGLIDG